MLASVGLVLDIGQLGHLSHRHLYQLLLRIQQPSLSTAVSKGVSAHLSSALYTLSRSSSIWYSEHQFRLQFDLVEYWHNHRYHQAHRLDLHLVHLSLGHPTLFRR